MSRVYADLARPAPHLTWGDRIVNAFARVVIAGAVLLLAAVLMTVFGMATKARAHEHWINEGRYTGKGQAADEWCCGEGDCFIVKGKVQGDGSAVVFDNEGKIAEIVPREEVQPSADGQFWRCRRYDGSRRCFFAPLPGS